MLAFQISHRIQSAGATDSIQYSNAIDRSITTSRRIIIIVIIISISIRHSEWHTELVTWTIFVASMLRSVNVKPPYDVACELVWFVSPAHRSSNIIRVPHKKHRIGLIIRHIRPHSWTATTTCGFFSGGVGVAEWHFCSKGWLLRSVPKNAARWKNANAHVQVVVVVVVDRLLHGLFVKMFLLHLWCRFIPSNVSNVSYRFISHDHVHFCCLCDNPIIFRCNWWATFSVATVEYDFSTYRSLSTRQYHCSRSVLYELFDSCHSSEANVSVYVIHWQIDGSAHFIDWANIISGRSVNMMDCVVSHTIWLDCPP